jgi:hypothetical protein
MSCTSDRGSGKYTKEATTATNVFNSKVGSPYQDGSLTADIAEVAPDTFKHSLATPYKKTDTKISTVGAYYTLSLFKGHEPYIDSPEFGIIFTTHMLRETRRQLSGAVTCSNFSTSEQSSYDNYISYINGGTLIGKPLESSIALDKWLTDETQNLTHPEAGSSLPWL